MVNLAAIMSFIRRFDGLQYESMGKMNELSVDWTGEYYRRHLFRMTGQGFELVRID